MKLSVFVFFLLLSCFFSANAYENLLFKPLTAAILEPRIGSAYHFSEEKLRLDIGTSIDLLDFTMPGNSQLRIGTDFMTYTRLRTESNFKFPVETSDYFFGINASWKGDAYKQPVSARVRIAHISSHLVDGLADSLVLRRLPFVYSREFIDVVFALEYSVFRPYLGATYVFSTQPKDVEPVIIQTGIDCNFNLTGIVNFMGGYDFRLPGFEGVYTGVHSLQYGLLFETSKDRGVLLSGYYYSGKSMHGMFYKENDTYAGFGFQVIF